MTADTPDLESIVRPIADEAKAKHSLRDRLAGGKQFATKKVIVFTDAEAVSAFVAADDARAKLQAALAATSSTDEEGAAALELLEQKMVDARAEMLLSALSIHMRAVPDVVMDAGRRAARKAYAVDGIVPAEHGDAANELQQDYVLGRVIQKIVEPDGSELEFERDEVAQMLREELPLASWSRVVNAYSEIVFTEGVRDSAVGDPGF